MAPVPLSVPCLSPFCPPVCPLSLPFLPTCLSPVCPPVSPLSAPLSLPCLSPCRTGGGWRSPRDVLRTNGCRVSPAAPAREERTTSVHGSNTSVRPASALTRHHHHHHEEGLVHYELLLSNWMNNDYNYKLLSRVFRDTFQSVSRTLKQINHRINVKNI